MRSNPIYVQALHHSHRLIKCSLTDHFVSRLSVSVVFFYRQAIPAELIIRSLEKTLCDFPLFAGTLLLQDGQLFIDCNNRGVRITIVESSSCLLEDFPSSSFIDPIDLKKGPVLTLQLNYFKDGMAIGYNWHHSIGDMATFMEFLKSLSANAKNHAQQLPTIHPDRGQLLKQEKGTPNSRLKQLSLIDLFYLMKDALTPKKNIYLYFTDEEINELRTTFCHKLGHKLTRIEALCAHLIEALAETGNARK